MARRPTNEEIAALAYKYYVEGGRQENQALENWLRAETLLSQGAQETASPGGSGGPGIEGAVSPRPEIASAAASASGRSKSTNPRDDHEKPFARDERGSAGREEIRQQTSSLRSAPRQPQRERGR